MKSGTKKSLTLKVSTIKVPRTNSSYNLRKKTPISPTLHPSTATRNNSSRHLSPFQQITSKETIYTHLLPSFCRIPRSPKNIAMTLLPYMSQENPKISTPNSLKSKIYSEISQFFYSNSHIFDNTLIKNSGFEANHQDLFSLKPGQSVSDTIIKIIFKIIQKKNRMKLLLKNQSFLNVFFVDLTICEKIAANETIKFEGNNKDLTKFSLIVFPFFFGYWTIAICDNENKVIKLFDPLGIESQDKLIKKGILRYLTKGSSENLKFRKFRYENCTESEVYDHVDSGIYILMRAYKICVKPSFEISSEAIEKFRVKILYYLLLEFYKGY